MVDEVERPKHFEIADSLLEMAQDVEIGHAYRLGVPAASFLRESADCISRQSAEIERLRAALREVVEYEKKFGIRDEGDGYALVSIARDALARELEEI
jgi:hypothetical protein